MKKLLIIPLLVSCSAKPVVVTPIVKPLIAAPTSHVYTLQGNIVPPSYKTFTSYGTSYVHSVSAPDPRK